MLLSAGTRLRFDNKAGAGFVAAGTLIEVYCNGTSINNCAIESADPNPTNLWAMPPSTTLIDAHNCEFVGFTGSTSNNYWAFDNCLFGGQRMCSVDELIAYTGSANQRVTLGRLIENATSEIVIRLMNGGLSGGGGIYLKNACMKLASADLLTRYRMDGTKPKTLTIGIISMSDDVDHAVMSLRQEAYDLIDYYIKNFAPYPKYRYYIRRTNRR